MVCGTQESSAPAAALHRSLVDTCELLAGMEWGGDQEGWIRADLSSSDVCPIQNPCPGPDTPLVAEQ